MTLGCVAGVDVSRETEDDLRSFAALAQKWNKAINLVSARDEGSIWDRHVIDSAQLMAHAPKRARSWLDIGSGGGFPGLVCALLAREINPALAFTLVDSDQRKVAFLREATRLFDLPNKIHVTRVEELPDQSFDIISARALAPLQRLFDWSHRFCCSETVLLFPKGRQHDSEISDASARWTANIDVIPSVTDPSAALLRISDLGPRL